MKNKLKFLTKQSLNRKIKTKWFKVANLLVAILLIGIINIDRIVGFFGGDFEDKTTIIVADEFGVYDAFEAMFHEYATALKEMKHYEVVQAEEDVSKLQEELKKDDDKILVKINSSATNYVTAEVISFDEIGTVSNQLITSTLNGLKTQIAANASGLSEKQILALTSPVEVKMTLTNPDAKDAVGKDLIATGVIMIFILPCFFLITLLVQMIGAEVNDEKSTRSMEIIISNVSPKVHFLSKIFSSTLFVVIQGSLIVLYALLGMLVRFLIGGTAIAGMSASATMQLSDLLKLVQETGILNLLAQGLLIILILFLCSFVAYAIVSGVLASMTTSIEDFQQLQTPLMIILLLGYYLALMASVFEGAAFIKIASYVPMLSFLLSPTLFLLGQIGLWELLLSTIITGGFTWLIFHYGLRIYKVGILNYSSSKLWKKMFQSLKSK